MNESNQSIRSGRLVRRWLLLLLCILVCMTAAAPVTAASKGTVSSVSVTNVTNGKLSLSKGKSFTLKVSVKGKGTFSKAVKYKSSNAKVVSVTGKGVLKALKKGTANITVTSSADSKKKAVVKVTVTIPVTKVTLNKTKATIAKGKTLQLTATVAPTTASNKKVTWKSSNTAVATVTAAGKVTAKKAGKATITATAKDGSKKRAACAVTVTTPVTSVTLNKKTLLLDKNEQAQLTATVKPSNATNKKVTFSSSNAKIVSVDTDGKIKGLKNGSAKITVTTADGKKTATCTVTVKTSVKSVALTVPESIQTGASAEATAKATPSDAHGVAFTYQGDKPAVATVSEDGTIQAISNGVVNVTVTATDSRGNKVTDSAEINVFTPVESVSLEEHSICLNKGEEKKLTPIVVPVTASNKKVSFSSSSPEVASVDENGLVKALSNGKATITVTTQDGEKEADCEVEVRIPVSTISLSVPDRITVGSEAQANASYAPEDAEGVSVIFQGDNREVAEVSEDGKVSAISNGIVKVMATATDRYGNMAYDEKDVTVWTPVSEVRLSESDLVLYEEEEKQLIVTVLPEEASQKRVSFTSSDESIVKVTDSGLVKAVAEGEAFVTVLSEDGEHRVSCTITVKKIQASAAVSTQAELEAALQNETLQQLTIQTVEAVSLTVPEGNYGQVSLIVNAPNGLIENYGRFKNIVLSSIGKPGFVEHAVGNDVIYKAEDGRIVTEPGAAITSLTVEQGAAAIDLVNNGDIANLMIAVAADVSISGENESRLNMIAAESARDAAIHTAITLKVEAQAVISLDLRAGSENTMVNIDTQEHAPVLTGIGEVPVLTRDTGVTESILADNVQPDPTRTIRISGTVQNTAQAAIDGASVYFIPYDSHIDDESIAARTGEALAAAVSDGDGKFLSDEIPIGNYYAYVAAEGYQPVCRKLSANSTYEDVYPFGSITMLGENETETGSISGTLTDARTNAPVPAGITVRLRAGADNKSGSFLDFALTDEGGAYSFEELPAGQYTVQVLDLRNEESGFYLTDYATLTVGGGMTADGGFAIRFSASDAGNQVTFTLTWGSEESGASEDLDSHLVGPSSEGGQFHTWYSSKEDYSYGEDGSYERYVFLDYDDTSYEGPENTTIEKSVNGVYHFYVHDYSNMSTPDSSQLSLSSAVVTVHSSEGTLGSFNVPNETGNLWHVCDYNSRTGKITAVNKVYQYIGDPSDIGVDLVEKYRGLLSEYLEKAQSLKHLANEETLSMLTQAEQTLARSNDADELMQAYINVRSFVNNAEDPDEEAFRFDDIYAYDEEDEAISIDWNYMDEMDDNGNVVRSYLDIIVESVTMPARLVFYPCYYNASCSEMEASDIDGYDGKVTITYYGMEKVWYIRYSESEEICRIGDVHAEDEDGNDVIDYWETDTSWIYDSDLDDYVMIHYLEINASKPMDSVNLTLSPLYDGVTVGEIIDSDISDTYIYYDKKVTLSKGAASRTYYIVWDVPDYEDEEADYSALEAPESEAVPAEEVGDPAAEAADKKSEDAVIEKPAADDAADAEADNASGDSTQAEPAPAAEDDAAPDATDASVDKGEPCEPDREKADTDANADAEAADVDDDAAGDENDPEEPATENADAEAADRDDEEAAEDPVSTETDAEEADPERRETVEEPERQKTDSETADSVPSGQDDTSEETAEQEEAAEAADSTSDEAVDASIPQDSRQTGF